MELQSKSAEVNLTEEQKDTIAKIQTKCIMLGYSVKFVLPIDRGPIVSVYRFMPQGGTKVTNIENISDDFAIALGVDSVFVKRLPGEHAVGLFVPNKQRTIVKFQTTVDSVWLASQSKDVSVPLNFGVDYLGRPFVEDLATLPHLLIAGSTGSGKSTLVSSIIASLMYCKPSVKFVLSDTKNVEFGHFEGAPQLKYDIAKTVYQTVEQLEYIIEEMSERLKLIGGCGDRNFHEYNSHMGVQARTSLGMKDGIMTPIVIIIDELADILGASEKMESGDNKRGPAIGKIAQAKLSTIVQKSRAAGVYVIACTQRPSVNVVIGSIKANFPARLSFRLPTEADSRTVLGISGAEHLLSKGDMLYISPNRPGITRLHAPFTELEDIKLMTKIAKQGA